MTKSTIIFDFDGTIADSFGAFVRVYNKIGKEYNLTQVNPKEAARLRGMTPKEVIRALKISLFTIPFYLWRGRSLFKKEVHTVQPIEGIIPILHQLAETHQLGILTSNEKSSVESFLLKHGLSMFDFIHSERNLFGKHKALLSLMKQYSLDASRTIYVGDEVRDIESCKKAHVSVAAVSWGLNTHDLLASYKPDYLFARPDELLSLP
ncbi:HAD-IA family hydrolase [Candidatus Woesebacteria bacterium]|nr:HAD-IA family hydrolase [Candidatus Woesebacteria bacterium]